MLHIGVNLGFGNLHEHLTDEQMVAGELRLAELADRLGYDSLWAVEHHFDDYCDVPGQRPAPGQRRRPNRAPEARHRCGDPAVERPPTGRREDDNARYRLRRPGHLRHGTRAVPHGVRAVPDPDERVPRAVRRGIGDDRQCAGDRLDLRRRAVLSATAHRAAATPAPVVPRSSLLRRRVAGLAHLVRQPRGRAHDDRHAARAQPRAAVHGVPHPVRGQTRRERHH